MRQEDIDREKPGLAAAGLLQQRIDLAQDLAGLLFQRGLAVIRDLAGNMDLAAMHDGLAHPRPDDETFGHSILLGFEIRLADGAICRLGPPGGDAMPRDQGADPLGRLDPVGCRLRGRHVSAISMLETRGRQHADHRPLQA